MKRTDRLQWIQNEVQYILYKINTCTQIILLPLPLYGLRSNTSITGVTLMKLVLTAIKKPSISKYCKLTSTCSRRTRKPPVQYNYYVIGVTLMKLVLTAIKTQYFEIL